MVLHDSCPCGSGLDYDVCCGRFLAGGVPPANPEQLMRSRYTAYTLGREDYLLNSWHESTRPESLGLHADLPVKWLGLKIVRTQAGKAGDNAGLVEFVARYKVNGKAERIHEVSRFVKEDCRWYYVSGEFK
jgi:SEC-C motif-containing protein